MKGLPLAIVVVLSLSTRFCLAADRFQPGQKLTVVVPIEMTTTIDDTVLLRAGTLVTLQQVEELRLFVSAGRLGWIDPAAVISAERAVEYFSKLVEENPENGSALLARGKVYFEQGKHDEAIADLDRSIAISPSSEAHTIRGFAWKRKGNKEQAMTDLDTAIELDLKNAVAWRVRGATWASHGEYRKAVAHYTESIRLDPDNPDSQLHRAMLLSACLEDDSIRDGDQAVKDATKACELSGWTNPLYFGGLAAAYAEAGDFESAVKWQTKVAEQSPNGKSRLELFRQGKPYRASWKK